MPSPNVSASSGCAVLLALSIVLIGFGYLAIEPPFDGFDEQAHYSSIRQITETGTIPVLMHSFIAPEVIDYRQHGPMAYGTFIAHTTRPTTYGHDETITYPTFFAAPLLTQDYLLRYRTAAPRTPYRLETEEMNWVAQHPPLYYLLMAPLMKATDSLPFVSQMFLLRLVSFGFAVAGLLIAFLAMLRYGGETRLPKRMIIPGFLLYPLIGPMFYREFARLGNDSLCLLLFGIALSLMLMHLRDETKKFPVLALGVCLGLGMLTKAFFLAFLGGFSAFMLLRLWPARLDPKLLRVRLEALVLVLISALLIGGWWYVLQDINQGSFIGDFDSAILIGKGGLFANLPRKLLLRNFLNENFGMLVSSSWSGSDANINPFLHIPLLGLEIWIFISYLRLIRHYAITSFAWLPVWVAVPFIGGLCRQMLIDIALMHASSETHNVGGWYLYVQAPVAAIATSYGMARITQKPKPRLLLLTLLFYATIFLLIVLWSQAALFGGCAARNAYYFYQFPDDSYCLDHWRDIASNLAILGWPFLAAFAFGGGFLSLWLGLFKARQLLTSETISPNDGSGYTPV
jgi:4-amino-4-deoxy-L-arabinose transferase-like glycosyltransferase